MHKKKISIIGGASISAAFIMKFIARHENAELKHVFSTSQAGGKVSSYHSFLTGITDIKYEAYDSDLLIKDSDVVFITKHHGEFIDETAKLVSEATKSAKKIKFIDLSADYRLNSAEMFKEWYNIEHKQKKLLSKAVYGLPELYRSDIKPAALVANPGCYPTCAILSLAPILKSGVEHGGICINALSGISGAGIRPSNTNIAMNVSENVFAYKVGGEHQHTPEIEQELSKVCGKSVTVSFVPHVVPLKYGIMETIYLKLEEEADEEDILNIYKDFYKGSRFVNIMPPPQLPQIKDVVGTNFANIGFKIDKRTNTLIIVGCIDNIIKGAAGQAVQNMNIMCGFNEDEGLI